MTDPIQHLRELHYQCVAPGGADCASDVRRYKYQMDLLRYFPALLAVAEAARAYMKHKFPNGDQSSMVTFSMQMPKLADDLLDALAKLDEVKQP